MYYPTTGEEEEEVCHTIDDATIDNEFTTSTTSMDEEEEVCTTIDQKLHSTCATTIDASNTNMYYYHK